ncbi:MAG: response regulator [Spirochaetales bacterium]|nr:response regulator [Spirochaetales bacterium]
MNRYRAVTYTATFILLLATLLLKDIYKILVVISLTLLLINIIQTIFDNKKKRNIKNFKNSLLTNISHEIKTPLNGILGMNNLLKASILTNEQFEFTKTISSCGEILLTTLNDILDYTKIGDNNFQLEGIQFDLRKLCRDFYYINRISTTMKDLKFSYKIDPELHNYFIGDPGRIRQILSNIFNNALKFTTSGEIELNCTLIQDLDNESTIEFSIRDTGIGIKTTQLNQIFSVFEQGDSSINRNHEGIGIGLAISKQLIKKMNGTIGVNSTFGEGSTFWINITLPKGNMLLKPMASHDYSNAKISFLSNNSGYNIKFIEELKNEISRIEINDNLPNTFNNLKVSNMLIFDFAFFNSNLEMENFIINVKANFPTLKTVAITSEGNRGDGELCRNLGIDGYFVTPIQLNIFLEGISLIVGRDSKENSLITSHTIIENKRSKIHILVVDDNNINIMVAQKLLSKMGFHSSKAENGLEAIEMLKKQDFNLVLMDIQMPVMNGLQATSEIRNQKAGYKNKDIPIIALTANYTQTDKENYSLAGMNEYLPKPFDPIKVEEVINRYISWNDL